MRNWTAVVEDLLYAIAILCVAGASACVGSDATQVACRDGRRNGDETGVDCGGTCPKLCTNEGSGGSHSAGGGGGAGVSGSGGGTTAGGRSGNGMAPGGSGGAGATAGTGGSPMGDAGGRVDTDDGPVLAFPGAQGFGAKSKGGRAGRIIYVTNLNDGGPGSLRLALSEAGPRIIVFRVAGTIGLDSSIDLTSPYVTIAGQTAPGGGIAVRHSGAANFGGALLSIKTHDVVIRHLRFRRGPSAEDDCCGDNITISDDAHDIIIDHCSLSFSTDELLNVWPGHDITMSANIFSQALELSTHAENGARQRHSYGPLIGSGSNRITMYRNLFAHNTGRNPRFTPTEGGAFQIVNNLVFNVCYAAMLLGDKGPQYNAIGNVILEGPDRCGEGRNNIIVGNTAKVFVSDNLTPYRKQGDIEWMATAEWRMQPPASEALRVAQAFDMPDLDVIAARDLPASLSPEVGATRPQRDSLDDKVIASIAAGTDLSIDDPSETGGWPSLTSGTPYPDEDTDGMDDAWEAAAGLNPRTDDGAMDRDRDGYSNVEEFLNQTRP